MRSRSPSSRWCCELGDRMRRPQIRFSDDLGSELEVEAAVVILVFVLAAVLRVAEVEAEALVRVAEVTRRRHDLRLPVAGPVHQLLDERVPGKAAHGQD